jgi:hypothetical protein
VYRQETPRAIPAHGKAKMLDCRDLLSEPVPCDAGSGGDRRLYVPGSRQKQPSLLPPRSATGKFKSCPLGVPRGTAQGGVGYG